MKNHFYMGDNSRTSYGIALVENTQEMPGIIEAAVDLSDDRDAVMNFVEYCNLKKLDVSRLDGAIDSFLQ